VLVSMKGHVPFLRRRLKVFAWIRFSWILISCEYRVHPLKMQ